MDLSMCKVVQLKELLRRRKLPTTGSKAELIVRLKMAEPNNDWESEIESLVQAEANGLTQVREKSEQEYGPTSDDEECSRDEERASTRDRHTRSEIERTSVRDRRTRNFEAGSEDAVREIEYMRREQALMEREMRILERENQILRSNTRDRTSSTSEGPTKHSVKSICELLSDFSGTEGTFRNWEKQARLLIMTYQLDDNSARILIGARLKNKALEWFHSRPEHIELSTDEILEEMRKMFDHKQSKLKLRKQFEDRKWKQGEAFSAYYHEKIILANRVPVNEEELLEYIIEGISNVQLRNQAKIRRFKSRAELLAAFESINIEEERSHPENKWRNKEQKDAHTEASEKKDASESSESQPRIRCYNCGKFGHWSRDCKAPKREKGTCFKCGENGHVIGECDSTIISTEINYVEASSSDNDFQKMVTIKLNDSNANYEIQVNALLDTGSPITLIKEKFIPDCFVKQDDSIKKFCGINGSKLSIIGTAIIDIKYDQVKEARVPIYVVNNNTMSLSPSMIIGRDLLKRAKISFTTVSGKVKESEINEILNIDTNNSSDNVSKALIVNPDICHSTRLELKSMYEKKYILPERALEPKVNAELTLRLNKVKEAIKALCDYCSKYSKPRMIVSDRGSCFTLQEFKNFMEKQEVKHVLIATGSPQSNGQAKRINRVIVPMLSELVNREKNQSWYNVLPQIEYALNNTINKNTGETPSRLLFGMNQRGSIEDRVKKYLDRNVKGPCVIVKTLRNDRYLVAEISGFQNTQKKYQGVWEAKNMRPWVSLEIDNG